MATGGLRCWGYNGHGQLGDGTTVEALVPPVVDALTDVQSVAVGQNHTCALTKSGGVRCWGYNQFGQLGDGSYNSRQSPPQNDVLTGVSGLSTGRNHTCAVMATGGVRCWGDNSEGQLGNGVPRYFTAAKPVPGTCE
jgi:alpha-tubulin suppressor-like RCC1 family protein